MSRAALLADLCYAQHSRLISNCIISSSIALHRRLEKGTKDGVTLLG
jgi:hypothetical protein